MVNCVTLSKTTGPESLLLRALMFLFPVKSQLLRGKEEFYALAHRPSTACVFGQIESQRLSPWRSRSRADSKSTGGL